MNFPPRDGYPFPPGQGDPGIGFSSTFQPGEGPGYSLYPQASGGFPCPPSQNPSSYPSPQNSMYPPALQNSSYPPVQGGSSPYPPGQNSYPYPSSQIPSMNPLPPNAPNPSPFNTSVYPPVPGSLPYSSAASSAPYAPSSAPYAPSSNPSPYPGSGAYPPPSNSTSHQSVPFPPGAGGLPYSPSPSQANYSPYPGNVPNQMSYGNTQSTSSTYPPPPSVSAYQSYGSTPSQSSYSASNTSSQVSGGSLWPYQERPTLRPAISFDPINDAAVLRKAMKGFGTDEQAIIQVLGRRTSHQRMQILQKYQQAYGKDLIKDLQKELSGSFEAVIVSLMLPVNVYLAQELNKAMQGLGTNEKTLIDILCTNDNNTLRAIKSAYQTQYKRSVEQDLRGDTSGDFKRLLVSMAAASRDEGNCNPALAPSLAQVLYKAGVQKKLGTDEAEFNRVMSCYSYPLLRCVFEEYKKQYGKTFESAIQSELSGDFRNGMLAIYSCINNRAAFFATYLNDAMKGFGTRDDVLIRIVISRAEIDMGNIKDEFSKIYGKRLEDAISAETSGDYKKILLALIQG